ncbi:MAG: hypothetical protein AAFV80_04325, partial [Bacteroidota bacterium]
MRIGILLLLCTLSLSISAQRTTLWEALALKKVDVQIVDLGAGPESKNIEFQIQNLSDESLELLIESGYVLDCDSSDRQDHVVSQGALVAVAPKAKVNKAVRGMCIQANNGSPRKGDTYTLTQQANGALEKVVKLIEKNHFQDATGQSAVWCVTNGNSIAGVYDENDDKKTKALMEFLAEILDQEMPWYNLKYQEHEDPNQNRVFNNAVSRVDARFKYELPFEAEVTFGIYYPDGRA